MFWNLIKLNLLFCLFALPSGLFFMLGVVTPLGIIATVLSLFAALPIGGAYCACLFCLSKMIRRDPGYLWYDFKRKYKENYKQAAVPGILCTLFVYVQLFLWVGVINNGMNVVWVLAGLVPLIIFGMVVPYIFLQISYIELGTASILKNSLILSFGHIGRSFVSSLANGAIWVVFALFFPESLPYSPLLLVFGFSVSWFLSLMCIWSPVNKQHAIEETLRKQSEDTQ
jgi:Protein of unknown function, DUF624.